MRTLTIVAALMLWAGVAEGGENWMSGNELLDYCEAKNGDRMLCLGFVVGVDQGAVTQGGHLCVSSKATYGQMADIVSKYLQEHPERRHTDAARLVITALQKAFPCPKK